MVYKYSFNTGVQKEVLWQEWLNKAFSMFRLCWLNQFSIRRKKKQKLSGV